MKSGNIPQQSSWIACMMRLIALDIGPSHRKEELEIASETVDAMTNMLRDMTRSCSDKVFRLRAKKLIEEIELGE